MAELDDELSASGCKQNQRKLVSVICLAGTGSRQGARGVRAGRQSAAMRLKTSQPSSGISRCIY
eukprot:5178263-Lingulodinium_polyedra.AAC.1